MIHGKYHGNTGYLLGNIDMGIHEFVGMGYCVDDMDRQVADDDVTWESHKSITQINRTNESHKTR